MLKLSKDTLDRISTGLTAVGLILSLVGKVCDSKKTSIEISEACAKEAKKAVADEIIKAQIQKAKEQS